MLALFVVLAVLTAGLAVMNLVQVLIHRQLFRPERSRRSPHEIAVQSRWAAVSTAGVSIACMGAVVGSSLIVIIGAVAAVAGHVALRRVRSASRVAAGSKGTRRRAD